MPDQAFMFDKVLAHGGFINNEFADLITHGNTFGLVYPKVIAAG